MNIKQLIKQGFKSFVFGGQGGSSSNDPYGGLWRPLAGSQYDYRREVGLPWENSIIMTCINWATRTFPEANLVLQRTTPAGWEAIEKHPAQQLLLAPNPHYDSSYLWMGLLTSWMIDGNAYWYMERNGFGNPINLYYMPHFQVAPRWEDDGSEFITDYVYRVAGKTLSLRKDDVVQFRNGVDLQNTRKGMSPLTSVLREICTDNETSTAAAAVMRNLGIPGLTFSPATYDQEITSEQKQKLREVTREKLTGDRRGELLVMPIPGKFEPFGFAPEQLAFDKIRRVPEERITAAYGIPAVVLGLGAGLERSTFSNFREAREAAYNSFLVPLWRVIAQQLTHQYLPAFGLDPFKYRFHFDISDVRELSEDEDSRHERIREDWKAGAIKRNEMRTELGYSYENDPEGWLEDDVFIDQLRSAPGAVTEEPQESDDLREAA